MSEKILVADDSPTIQKVVGITLANTDFELSPAHSVEELFNFLESDSFDLILLDFNLSEEKDGYELSKEIREKAGTAKIIVMLGTFDSVDEGKLTEVGVSEKVIKPFESTKFIQKINDTLAGETLDSGFSPLDMIHEEEDSTFGAEEEDNSQDDDISEGSIFDESDEDDEWSMSGPSAEEDDVDDEEDLLESAARTSSNELHAEMAGWGMEVPSVIGSGEGESLMPPVMDGSEESNDHHADETGEWDAEQLGFGQSAPISEEDISFKDNVNSFDESVSQEESKNPMSSLISLDELVDDEDDQDEMIDDTDPQIIIEKSEDDPSLEAELSGDMDANDFWAADESYDLDADSEEASITINPVEDDLSVEQHSPIEVGPKIEADAEKVGNKETLDALNDLAAHQNEVGPKIENVSNISTDEVVRQVIDQLKPQLKDLVKEVMQEFSKETIEGVAWEIIPDLAENLIRHEVENLSKKVQEKHSLN